MKLVALFALHSLFTSQIVAQQNGPAIDKSTATTLNPGLYFENGKLIHSTHKSDSDNAGNHFIGKARNIYCISCSVIKCCKSFARLASPFRHLLLTRLMILAKQRTRYFKAF